MNWARHSPPDIGGVDATSRRSREASFNGADGVVGNGNLPKERIPKHFVNPDHPVCAAAVASPLFLDGAATPPVSAGGELPHERMRQVYSRPLRQEQDRSPLLGNSPGSPRLQSG